MSTRKVSFLISANATNFIKGLNKAQKRFSRFGKNLKRTGSDLTSKITAPLGAVAGLSLKAAADFEKLEQSLSILNGSAEEGARVFNKLKNLSAGTPFQLKDLAKAQQTLQGFGLSADTSFDSIKQIGDIAAVTGGDIQNIAVAFGQAGAEGKLMSKDIRQLINNGVPALQLLADAMGVSKDQVFDLASAGEISFEVLQKAFKGATTEGGMFADGMKQQSQTLSGIFSTLKDNVSIALGELGTSLVESFDLKNVAKDVIQFVQNITEKFRGLSARTKKIAFTIAGVLGAGGPVLIALGAMSSALAGLIPIITAIVSPVGLVVAAIGGLAAAVLYVWDNWKAVKERISDIGWWKNALLKMLKFLIEYSPISLMIKQLNTALSFFGQKEIPNPFESLAGSLDDLMADTKEYKNQFGSFKDAVLNGVNEMAGINLSSIFSSGQVKPKSIEVASSAGVQVPSMGNELKTQEGLFRKVATTAETSFHKMMKSGKKFTDDLANNLVPMISSALGDAAGSFIEMSATALVSGQSLSGVFNSVLTSLADLAIRVGKIAITTGLAIQGIKKALQSLNPAAAIAAGVALVALGSVVKSKLKSAAGGDSSSKIPKMASGGIVPAGYPNDTYPAFLSSGETVIPPNKLGQIGQGMNEGAMTRAFAKALSSAELRAKGSDLALVLNNVSSTYR